MLHRFVNTAICILIICVVTATVHRLLQMVGHGPMFDLISIVIGLFVAYTINNFYLRKRK